jgi:hypothetical protein
MKSGEMILDYVLDHNDNMQTVEPFNRKVKTPVVIYFRKCLQSVSDTVTENKSTSLYFATCMTARRTQMVTGSYLLRYVFQGYSDESMTNTK